MITLFDDAFDFLELATHSHDLNSIWTVYGGDGDFSDDGDVQNLKLQVVVGGMPATVDYYFWPDNTVRSSRISFSSEDMCNEWGWVAFDDLSARFDGFTGGARTDVATGEAFHMRHWIRRGELYVLQWDVDESELVLWKGLQAVDGEWQSADPRLRLRTIYTEQGEELQHGWSQMSMMAPLAV